MRCVLLANLGLAVMVLTLFLLLGDDSNRSVSRVPQPSLSLKLEIIEQDFAESVLKVRATANWNSQAPIEFRTPEDLALHNVDDDYPPPFMRTIELRVNDKRRSGYRGNDCFSRPQAHGYYVSGGAEAALQFRQAKPYYRKLRLDKPYECNLASVLREPADYEICLFASWHSTLAEVNRAKGLPANHPPTDLELAYVSEIEDPVTGERTILYPGPPIASNWLKVKVTDPMPPIPRIDFDKWLAERKAEVEAEKNLKPKNR